MSCRLYSSMPKRANDVKKEKQEDESCGRCPKLGGTADKHIRPCHVDGRGDFSFTPLALVEGACHETIF